MDGEYVKGLDELLKELQDLPGNVEKGSLRTAMFRAAQFMRDKVKEAAPVGDNIPPKGGRFKEFTPGTLKNSFKAKRRRGTRQEVATGITAIFYAKWIEFGHVLKSHGNKKIRKGKKASRKVIGHVAPNPFILNTFEANKEQVVEMARKGFAEQVQKAVDRLRAKMPKSGG